MCRRKTNRIQSSNSDVSQASQQPGAVRSIIAKFLSQCVTSRVNVNQKLLKNNPCKDGEMREYPVIIQDHIN